MITNTDLFFVKAKDFQDKRIEILDGYEKNLKALERFKGSQGYEEDVKKLNEALEADLSGLRDEYFPGFITIFGGMVDAIGRRSVKAPTNEQLNLLQLLRMKKKVTLEELERTAEAVKDNPIAIGIITEISKENDFHRDFSSLCPEMSSETASELVKGMKSGLDDFMRYNTTKASRLAKKYHEDHYGDTEATLTKRRVFTDKEGCFWEVANMDRETMIKFSEIVDAKKESEE